VYNIHLNKMTGIQWSKIKFKFLEMWVAYSVNIESIMTAVMRLNGGETAVAALKLVARALKASLCRNIVFPHLVRK
jgi:hypothetical protein